jgi:hypothetical protein
MIIHKRIQNDYEKGSIEIQINFDVDHSNVKVSNIHIHDTFDSGLPASPTFEEHNSKNFLVAHYTKDGKKIFERIIGNIYADNITEHISEIIIEITKNLK